MDDVAEADLEPMWEDWARTVTLRRRTGATTDVTAGSETHTTSDTTGLSVVRGTYRAGELPENSALAPGDAWFKIKASDISFTPTQRDLIIDGSDEHEVVEVSLDGDGNVWQLGARRLLS